MTEFWKSNERKYCDFCKCWLSDNKVSVSFHENGKRHKLAVAQRITDISRESEKSEREKQKHDDTIRKMEEAAMRSYTQDIHRRGDLTARSIGTVMEASSGGPGPSVTAASTQSSSYSGTAAYQAAISSRAARQVDPMRLPGNSDDEDGDAASGPRVGISKVAPEVVPNASLWVEGKSEESGHTYYWNVKTNESVWQPPKEGFLSWTEYQRINEIALKQQSMQDASEAKHFRANVDEEVARFNRERLKQFRKPDTIEEKEVKRVERERKNAFKTEEEASTQEIGGWQSVEAKPPPEPINWELPQFDNYNYVPPVAAATSTSSEPPVKRFKEKTCAALEPEWGSSGTETTFKKRKFAAKGNARKRLNDD